MTTRTNLKPAINRLAFSFLTTEGFPFSNIITFLLKSRGIRKLDIAREAGCSTQYVNMVLAGSRTSQKVQDAISQALGFYPWA